MKTLSLLLAPLLVAASPVAQPRDIESLDTLYKGVGKIYFGTIAEKGKLESGENAKIIQSRFGQVTPEYSMKWDQTEPNRGQFSFDTPDYLVNWAVQNGKSIRGHALLWHIALPQWVQSITDKGELKSVIENHISNVVGRWKGKIRAWDVVNEIFNDDGTLRTSVFSSVLGEEFVGIAFRAARAADPNAKLYINDYNLDNADWAKLPALVRKVDEWKAQGIPIDGIGSQSHLQPGKPSLNSFYRRQQILTISGMAGAVETALRELAAANVDEVAVTELDIAGANPQEYQTVVQACYHVPHCVGVTTWGIRDSDSWQPNAKSLLFGDDWAPKDAYYAIRDWLRGIQK
jgi:endo-1,4-beta-xylanase